MVFGREPAQITGLIASAITLLSSTLAPLTDTQQGVLNAVVVAILGLVTASQVSAEKAAPAIAGLVQAVLACALAFGAHLTQDQQGAIMAFVAAAVGFWLRTQVVAPVPDQPTTRRG